MTTATMIATAAINIDIFLETFFSVVLIFSQIPFNFSLFKRHHPRSLPSVLPQCATLDVNILQLVVHIQSLVAHLHQQVHRDLILVA